MTSSKKEIIKLASELISEENFKKLRHESKSTGEYVKSNLRDFESNQMSLIHEYKFVEQLFLTFYWANWKEGLIFGLKTIKHSLDTMIFIESKEYEIPISIDNLINSSMKIYKNLGVENNFVILKDILTDKMYSCISTSKYEGTKDELWFVRLVPNLDSKYDYQIILNTPYVIINQTEGDWIKYFQRQGIDKDKTENEREYKELMKYHKEDKYWHNYIMDGYVDYRPNCIYLTGIPE